MEAVLLFGGCIAALVGLGMVIFVSSKRKNGLVLVLAGCAAIVIAINMVSAAVDEDAVAEGWESFDDMQEAEAAGFDDPDAWASKKAADAAARREAGFHCLSQWDGSHTDFKRVVRDAMREPDSFEHIETRIAPVDEDGQHALVMEYRARNGFGGMNAGQAIGTVAQDDCSFEVLEFE